MINKKEYALDTKVKGMEIQNYLADLLEKNDNQEIEIERCKQAVAIVKQLNNNSRIILDAHKHELKKMELEIKQLK